MSNAGDRTPILTSIVGDTDEFFRDYWGKTLFRSSLKRDSGLHSAFRFADLDYVIKGAAPEYSGLRVVKAGRTPSFETYYGNDRLEHERVPSLARLYDAFDQGFTISLTRLQDRLGHIGRLTRSLEVELGHRVNINCYASPEESVGFPEHFDTHDVFILQMEGTKDWTVYEPQITLPLPGQAFSVDTERLSAPLLRTTLQAGDILYLPRGFVHHGHTMNEPSLHLTIGVYPYTYLDLMKYGLEEFARLNEPLRHALEPARGSNDLPSVDISGLLAYFETLDLSTLREKFRAHSIVAQTPPADGHFSQWLRLRTMSRETWVEHRNGYHFALDLDDNGVAVYSADTRLVFPESAFVSLNSMREREKFQISDVTCGLPITVTTRIVARLVRAGMLRLA